MSRSILRLLFVILAPAGAIGCSLAVDLNGLDDGRLLAPIDASATTDASDASASANPGDAAVSADGGEALLLAYYPFDQAGGTIVSDESGSGLNATLMGGASFARGLDHNAATLSGNGEYVALPSGILDGLTAFSISGWVYLNRAPTWTRIFDFGTGTNTYMMLTAASDAKTLRFAITVSGDSAEQRIDAAELPTGSWQHVAVTFAGTTGILYVNGVAAAENPSFTIGPASLGTTTRNWLGRSQFSVDPYLSGQIDELRIYAGALTAAEVRALAAKP